MKKGFVYLLEEYRNEEIAFKIGFTTKSVESRVKQLQTGNSSEIVIVSSFKTKHYLKVEKILHNKFNTERKRGEWFDLDEKTALTFYDECINAVNIIESLNGNPFY